MLTHCWSILCTRYITDRHTNRVSAIDILESVQLIEDAQEPGVLAEPFRAYVISSWGHDDSEALTAQVKLDVMNGRTTVESSGEKDLKFIGKDIARSIFSLEVLALNSGNRVFRVSYRTGPAEGWKLAASLPLSVMVGSAESISRRQHNAAKPNDSPKPRRRKSGNR